MSQSEKREAASIIAGLLDEILKDAQTLRTQPEKGDEAWTHLNSAHKAATEMLSHLAGGGLYGVQIVQIHAPDYTRCEFAIFQNGRLVGKLTHYE